MSVKVDYFYPFSKGFFGKTLSAQKNNKLVNEPVLNKVKPDSISDFSKHFENKMTQHCLERAPKVDAFQIEKEPELFPNMMSWM